jgi:hypothetical protein
MTSGRPTAKFRGCIAICCGSGARIRSSESPRARLIDGAASDRVFVLRWFSSDPVARSPESDTRDRLIVVNLGADLHFDPAPEP